MYQGKSNTFYSFNDAHSFILRQSSTVACQNTNFKVKEKKKYILFSLLDFEEKNENSWKKNSFTTTSTFSFDKGLKTICLELHIVPPNGNRAWVQWKCWAKSALHSRKCIDSDLLDKAVLVFGVRSYNQIA